MTRLCIALLLASSLSAAPRPIGDAERQGVAVAAAFLANGPSAIYEKLSPDAPLRALAREDALREIAARTGPNRGARWSLQTTSDANDVAFHITFPSGADDGLLLRMTKDGAIREIRTLAENPPKAQEVVPPRSIRGPLLLAAIALALIAAFVRPIRIVAVLLAAAALGVAIYDPPIAPRAKRELGFVELRALAPLRDSLARGGRGRIPFDASKEAQDVARLWLGQLVETNTTPLGELVKARHAIAQNRASDATAAFDRALAIAPMRDDVLVEAALSFEGDAAQQYLAEDRFPGARDPRWYYARARRNAPRDLETAWRLRPIPREDIVRDPRLFPLLRDVRAMSTVSLLSNDEPRPRSPQLATKPVALPQNARAFVCGEFLRIEIGDARLEVPGGAVLAPANAQLVPATHWQREDDAAALHDAEAFLKDPALATPFRLTRAAQALAHHNRWRELLTLTKSDDSMSPEVVINKLTALLRTSQFDEARAFANSEAMRELMRRPSSSGALVAAGDAMTAIGNFDGAANFYRAVRAQDYQDIVESRIRQLELRRALATTAKTITTEHFEIRHDASMNPAIASRIGDLLEAELARLRQKFPPVELRRIVVNVLYWDDFRGGITGSDHILGLYDGEILFPFAVVNQFKPEVVAIITHELTHALVAQATGDNAPRWFQEGVAQRMELVPHQENAFHAMPPAQVLPASLLDAVMENATDPFTIDHGYRVARTFVRYLEAVYGAHAIEQLTTEFAKGTNTDDALAALTGKSFEAINREFREWGFANNGNFTSDEAWPYSHLYSPGIDPRVREGFKWGKRPN